MAHQVLRTGTDFEAPVLPPRARPFPGNAPLTPLRPQPTQWCGHCKRLAPAWEELATEVKGSANIGKVDCTVNANVCSRYSVKGYPTLRLFADGPNADSEKYSGARTVEAFKEFLGDRAGTAGAAYVPHAPAPPPIRVLYFQTRGRAEVIRLTLERAGLPYEQRLHARDEWPAIKEAGVASGALPFGQVPALEYGGRTLVQTDAILRFLSAKHAPGAYAALPAESRYAVDAAVAGAEDLRKRYGKLVYSSSFSEETRREFAAGEMRLWLGQLERLLRANKEGNSVRFVGGEDGWTLADVAVFDVLNAVLGVDAGALRETPALAVFHAAHVGLFADYLASDRRPAFQNGASAFFDNEANPSGYRLPLPAASRDEL